MKTIVYLILIFCGISGNNSLGQETWKFAIIGDSHDEVPQNESHHGVAADYILTAYQGILKHQVDFVIQVGDLVDTRTTNDPKGMEFRHSLNKILEDHQIPFYAIRGNHDQKPVQKQGFIKYFFPKDPKKLKNYFQKDLNYGFEHNNASLYFLDVDLTNQPKQLLELVQVIKKRTQAKTAPRLTFLFSHYPLQSPHNIKENIFGKNNEDHADLQNQIYATVCGSRVPLWFAGHLHSHILATYKSPDLKHSIHQLICAPCGEKSLPLPFMTEWGNRVNLIDYRSIITGYYIITVSSQTITIDFYGAHCPCNANQAPPLKDYKKMRSRQIKIH